MGRIKTPVIVGVDPGGAHTGIVVRDARKLVDHALVERDTHPVRGRGPVELYAALCAERVLALGVAAGGPGRAVFKIERVVPPRWYSKGHERPINPANLIDVAIVAGVIAGRVAAEYGGDAVQWVRPGGHGKTPELPAGPRLDRYMNAKYPAGLLPARKGVLYKDGLRHCRSAWDVSMARPDFKGA